MILKRTGLLLLLLLAGCAGKKTLVLPSPAPPVDRFVQAPAPDKSPAPVSQDAWWLGYKSSRLEGWINQALQKNRELLAARAQLEQSLARHSSSLAYLFPQASLSLGHTTTKAAESAGNVTGATSNKASLSLGLSYEIDLFGKRAAQLKSLELAVLLAAEQYKLACEQTVTSLIKAWLKDQELLERLRLLEQSIKADRQNQALVQNSFALGNVKASDLIQAQNQLDSTLAQKPDLELALVQTRQQIQTLIGDYPSGQLAGLGQRPADLPLPPVGLPSQLLQKKPALRAALLKVRLSDQELAAAVAAQYPSFSLTATQGSSSEELSQLSDPTNAFWNLAANLTLPIFDAGARRDEVKRVEKLVEERLQDYQTALHHAFSLVELNLVRQKLLLEKKHLQQRQLASAKENLTLTQEDYAQGQSSLFQVITAQNQVYALERSLVVGDRERREVQADLYLALGGTWMEEHFAQVLRPLLQDLDEPEPNLNPVEE